MGLRKSGCRGEKGENLNGFLDLYSFRPTSGGLRLWFTLIGAQQADALLLKLQAARREADAGWKIQTGSIADAFTEGARRGGHNFRMRHTAPSVVQGVWGDQSHWRGRWRQMRRRPNLRRRPSQG